LAAQRPEQADGILHARANVRTGRGDPFDKSMRAVTIDMELRPATRVASRLPRTWPLATRSGGHCPASLHVADATLSTCCHRTDIALSSRPDISLSAPNQGDRKWERSRIRRRRHP